MLSVERDSCPPASCPHPRHSVQIRGLFGSPSKPSGRGRGAVCVAGAPEAVLGLLSLGPRPSGNMRTPTGCLGPAAALAHAECLAGAEEAGWQGELSGARSRKPSCFCFL